MPCKAIAVQHQLQNNLPRSAFHCKSNITAANHLSTALNSCDPVPNLLRSVGDHLRATIWSTGRRARRKEQRSPAPPIAAATAL